MSGKPGRGGKPEGWRRLPQVAPADRDEENDDELRFHLEMRTRDYMERGMSENEARAAARERLGDVEGVRDELGDIARVETRAERRRERLSELTQDVRYGARMLARAPAFTAMAALTLAIGIGATTAIFSLVYAVLLAPLPYAQPDRLVRIWETSPRGATRNVVSPGNALAWEARTRSFSVMGAHLSTYPVTLTGEDEPARVVIETLQPSVFRALDVSPALGRTLVDRDAVDGGAAAMSHALWQSRYAGDPAIVGRRVVLNDLTYTVVGVMAADFTFPTPEVDFWLPVLDRSMDPEERTSHNYQVVARLAPGATRESAQTEMSRVAAQIASEHPAQMTGWSARVVPLHDDLVRNVRTLLWVLLGGVAVVLLIACGNLANLLLARAFSRQREIAVRGALGASRGRIVRQLLTESVLLSGLGGVGALVIAPMLLRVLVGVAPADLPLLDRAAIDLRMLGFTGAAALACALVFGMAPALHLSAADAQSALRSSRGSSQSGHARLRAGLLVAQVALSVVLLIGAGLFVRSFRAIQSTDVGFEPAGLTVMDVDLPSPRYPETQEHVAFYDALVERVRALPGVAGAAGTSQPPGSLNSMTFSFAIEGRVATNPNGREDAEILHAITPGYFEVIGRPMAEGRSFDTRDRADGVPVVILSESLARRHFPEGDAVGHRIAFRVGETPWREIVGVVRDARLGSPDREPEPGIFIPYAQKTWPWLTWTTVVARTEPGIDPTSIAPGLRGALLELDPDLPPQSIGTVEAAFRSNTAPRTFAMALVGGFGGLALVLCVVGLYGLLTFSVARERREIGVRIALGAGRGPVVRRILLRSLGLALLGSAAGVAIAIGAARLIASLLYGVSPVDGATYALTVAFVTTVAIGAALLPALRAARTDPLLAIRAE